MSLALLRLLLLSIRGRIRRAIAQLRQPKYLIGLLIGLTWFWFSVFQRSGAIRLRTILFSGAHEKIAPEWADAVRFGLTAPIVIVFTILWLIPARRLALGLKESEFLLLLPAPVSRRDLLQFALLKKQAAIVFTAAMFTALLGRLQPGSGFRLFLGLWILFSIIELHDRIRAIVLVRIREMQERSRRTAQAAILGCVILVWAVLGPRLVSAGKMLVDALAQPAVTGGADIPARLAELAPRLGEVGTTGLVRWVLAPFYAMMNPLFSAGSSEFFLSLLLAAAILILLHELVVRSRVTFDEKTLQDAKVQVRRKSRKRVYTNLSEAARKLAPFQLEAPGRPEVSVLWKNLLKLTRRPLLRYVRWGAIALLLATFLPATRIVPSTFSSVEMVFGIFLMAWVPAFSGMFFRNDLRGDLSHLDVVRTWPVRGTRMLLAWTLSPAILGAMIGIFGAGLTLAGYFGTRVGFALNRGGEANMLAPISKSLVGQFSGETVLLFIIGLLPFIIALSVFSSAIQNLGVVLLPSWFGFGLGRAKGFAATGHHIAFAWALGLGLGAGLLPPTILVGAVVVIQLAMDVPWSAWEFPVFGAAASMILLVEAAFLIKMGARLWDKLDLSKEILES